MAAIGTLIEDWASGAINGTTWPTTVGTPAVASQKLALTGSNQQVQSAQTYTMTDSVLLAQIDITGYTGTVAMALRLYTNVTNNDYFEVFLNATTWFASEKQASTVVGTQGTGSFTAATEQWWKITHDTGVGVRFWVSTNGNTWTLKHTIAAPTITVSSAVCAARLMTTTAHTATGTGTIDNVNVPTKPIRVFNGSSDGLSLNPGATVGMDGGPLTIAMLFKRNSTTQQAFITAANNATATTSSFAQQLALWFQSDNLSLVADGSTQIGASPALTVVNADGWVLIVATKAGGSATPRFHRYNLGTATITRQNGSAAVGDGSALTSTHRWTIGKDEFTGHVGIKVAVVSIWNAQLSDAQVDELYAHLSTQDWMNNSAGLPKALWEFSQASTATAVTDLTAGGADQFDISGTTVDFADPPPGWTFGATAPPASAPPQVHGIIPLLWNVLPGNFPPALVAPGPAVVNLTTANLGTATETDTALAITTRKSKTIGIALETDASQTIIETKRKAVGIANEADTSTPVARVKAKLIGLASETDSSLTITKQGRVVNVTMATETDSALGVIEKKARTLGTATEADTSITLTRVKKKSIGFATESDSAISVTERKSRALGLATETDTSQPFARRKVKTLGLTPETDSAIGITFSGAKLVTVTRALETDSSQPLGVTHKKAITFTTETDNATPITRSKLKGLGIATNTQTAQALVLRIRPKFVFAADVQVARPIDLVKSLSAAQLAVPRPWYYLTRQPYSSRLQRRTR
jgi:hypothetical protein